MSRRRSKSCDFCPRMQSVLMVLRMSARRAIAFASRIGMENPCDDNDDGALTILCTNTKLYNTCNNTTSVPVLGAQSWEPSWKIRIKLELESESRGLYSMLDAALTGTHRLKTRLARMSDCKVSRRSQCCSVRFRVFCRIAS